MSETARAPAVVGEGAGCNVEVFVGRAGGVFVDLSGASVEVGMGFDASIAVLAGNGVGARVAVSVGVVGGAGV